MGQGESSESRCCHHQAGGKQMSTGHLQLVRFDSLFFTMALNKTTPMGWSYFMKIVTCFNIKWEYRLVFVKRCRKNSNPTTRHLESVKSADRHLTVTRLLPPGVHVYSDRSNPLLIISFVAFAANVSNRKTSYW